MSSAAASSGFKDFDYKQLPAVISKLIFMLWIIITLVLGLKIDPIAHCAFVAYQQPLPMHVHIYSSLRNLKLTMTKCTPYFESNEEISEGKGKLCVTKNYEIPYQIEIGFENTF